MEPMARPHAPNRYPHRVRTIFLVMVATCALACEAADSGEPRSDTKPAPVPEAAPKPESQPKPEPQSNAAPTPAAQPDPAPERKPRAAPRAAAKCFEPNEMKGLGSVASAKAPFADCSKNLKVHCVGGGEGLCGYPLNVEQTKRERETRPNVCCYAVK
jgi:outer membrane biosynthesis protein TonB